MRGKVSIEIRSRLVLLLPGTRASTIYHDRGHNKMIIESAFFLLCKGSYICKEGKPGVCTDGTVWRSTVN